LKVVIKPNTSEVWSVHSFKYSAGEVEEIKADKCSELALYPLVDDVYVFEANVCFGCYVHVLVRMTDESSLLIERHDCVLSRAFPVGFSL
jgi:hypothetical protein